MCPPPLIGETCAFSRFPLWQDPNWLICQIVTQWRKYSACIIVPLWKDVISTFLEYSELEMKEWSIRNFVFLLNFFIVPDNPRSLTHDVSTYISSRNCRLWYHTMYDSYITKEISWASHEETAHSSKFKRPALPCICLIRLYWFSTIRATKPLWLTLFINWKCGRSDSVVKADTTRRLEGRSRWNIHPRQNYTSYHSQAVFMMLGAMCIWDVPLNLKLWSYSFGSY